MAVTRLTTTPLQPTAKLGCSAASASRRLSGQRSAASQTFRELVVARNSPEGARISARRTLTTEARYAMGLLDNIKSIASTVQKIGNIELYRQILDLQSEAMGLLEQKAALEEENRSLREKLQVRSELKFEHNAYWRRDPESGSEEGPYCSNCWDTRQSLVRLHQQLDPNYVECPTCKKPIRKADAPPLKKLPLFKTF